MSRVTMLTGGARSGKSTRALELAMPYARRGFIATAEAFDGEMRDRIVRHKEERGRDFVTIEEPLDVAGAIRGLAGAVDVAIVDCLTVWLGNVLHYRGTECEEYDEMETLLGVLTDAPYDVIVVTNEVGLGIVPGDALSRRYRDLLGGVNRRVAAVADEVVMMVSGLPLVLKG